ncbi:MAG: V4R domain-containing protein [Candidatus Methanomethylicaceae archaeon]
MGYPLDLSRYIKLPNRELLEILIKQKDKSSFDISKICDIIKTHNVELIYNITYYIDGLLHMLMFLDISDLNISTDEFIQEFKKEPLEVLEFSKSKIKGVLIDTISFPLFAGKSRVVIFRDLAYSHMIQGIREKFGSGGEALLYYIGFESGKGFGKLHKEFAHNTGINNPFEIFNIISATFFQWAGFGKMEVIEITERGGLIKVYDNFECEIMKKKSKKPYSQFIRGAITGVLSEIFNKEVSVIEEMCLAKGDDLCKFRIFFKNQ